MPFTPFHLGPGLGIGLPLKKYIHTPTFLLANVIVDIEPFIVFFFGLSYPLHGYLHTFLVAFLLGLLLGYIMFLLERFLHPLFTFLLLESTNNTTNFRSFIFAGSSGTMLHVLMDSPLYSDILPFYPLKVNPLYNPSISLEIYGFCVLMGLFGTLYYVILFFLFHSKKLKETDDNNNY